MVQGFFQKPSIDFEEMYSLVMDIVIFCHLISLTILQGLDMCFVNVGTTYLYGWIRVLWTQLHTHFLWMDTSKGAKNK